VHAGLKEAGILIKAFTGHPRLGDHLRVSIGTPAENRAFLAALEELL
jgi:histidinol-phosphate aminotransferase